MTLHEKILQDLFVLIPHLGHCLVDQCSPRIVFLIRTVSRTASVSSSSSSWDACVPMLSLDEMDASSASRDLRRTLLAIIVSVWTIQLTDQIKYLSYQRDNLKKKAIKLNSEYYHKAYKNCRNQVTNLIMARNFGHARAVNIPT